MKRTIVYFFIMLLSITLSNAQNCQDNLFGETYTYLNISVYKKNNYPVCFNAVTKADSINVDLSNLDTFVESIFSRCDFVADGIMNGQRMAFEKVYGKSANTLNALQQFWIIFAFEFHNHTRATELFLRTGEIVYIEYLDITGIFYRGDKAFIGYTSDGLPENMLTMETAIIPIALSCSQYKKDELVFNYILH